MHSNGALVIWRYFSNPIPEEQPAKDLPQTVKNTPINELAIPNIRTVPRRTSK